ncbi:hypothetical protein PR202_ga18207 [Eleusine coracana subsp. coracana]|uniref:Early nodulin-93-like n=1 Tax=Eleusine coracana subsp. coracana TaxID=191504 RepID=A0AAV5CSE3_ELECO|nr:hypothetical protein PR202_ga18207 [Eleusine coracana subsp. coracana]
MHGVDRKECLNRVIIEKADYIEEVNRTYPINLHSACFQELQVPNHQDMATVSCASLEQKLALAKRCSREATLAGAKAAAVATIASAIPTLASVRMLPWAKANINPTGQALIISTVAGMAYFIAADKKILSLARKHSFEGAPDHLKNTSFQGAGRPHPAFFRP